MAATAFSLIGRISMSGINESLKQVEGLQGKVQNLQKELGRLGNSLNKAGSFLTKNLTVPLAAAATAIGALSLKTGEYASKLSSLEQETGLTSDTLQEFEHVAKVTGGSSDALFGSITALTNKMPEIAKGSGDAAKALDQLGINVTNTDGSYRDMNELFPQIITKLGTISDITTRNALATDIFGKKSKELATFMGMSAGEMGKLRNEAHSMGLVMSKDALKSADDFRIGVEKLKAQLGAIGNDLAVKVIPILNDSLIPLLQSTLIPALKAATDAVGLLAKGFGALPDGCQTVVVALTGVVGALGPIALIGGKVALAVKALIPILSSLAVTMGAATAGASGLGTALMGLATGIALPLAAIASLASAVVVCYREFSTLKRLKEEAAEDEKFSQQTQTLYKTAMAAKKLRDEYAKLKGTEKFDQTEFDKLQNGYENATIALQNHNRVRQGMQPLNEQELVHYRNKLRGIKEVSEAERQQTEYALAQAKERAKALAEEAAKRKKELADMIADYDEKYEAMFRTAEEQNRHEEELAVQKAQKAKATEEEIYTIRQYYNELRQRMEDDAEKKRAEEAEEELKKIEERHQKELKYIAELQEVKRNAAIENMRLDGDEYIKALTETHRVELANIQQHGGDKKALQIQQNTEMRMLQTEVARQIADAEIDAKRESLQYQFDMEIKEATEAGTETSAIRERYNVEFENLERQKVAVAKNADDELTEIVRDGNAKRSALNQSYVQGFVSGMVGAINQLGSIMATYASNEEKRVDREYKQKKEAIEANVTDETARKEQLAALEEEQEAKKLAIQKEQAKREKALGIFNTIVNTATAIVKALAELGPIAGPIMAGVVGALGIAQTAVIASTPEPFYDGGLVQGSPNGIVSQVGERNQSELIMPLDKGVEILADKLSKQGAVGNNYTINVNVGNMIADDQRAIKELGRKIREVLIAEDRRTGG